MERTLIAYILMALLIAAGIGMGLHLRRNSRERSIRRRRARVSFQREVRTNGHRVA
jgi:hypothetical protein